MTPLTNSMGPRLWPVMRTTSPPVVAMTRLPDASVMLVIAGAAYEVTAVADCWPPMDTWNTKSVPTPGTEAHANSACATVTAQLVASNTRLDVREEYLTQSTWSAPTGPNAEPANRSA